MKIIRAYVRDLRREEDPKPPVLVIEMDEDLHATSDPLGYGSINGDWIVQQHGPFVSVDWADDKGSQPGNIGAFNSRGGYKARVVPVIVLTPEMEIPDMCMDLIRARRLMRRHELPWRFVLDEHAGERAELSWRLKQTGEVASKCLYCAKYWMNEVYLRGTYLPMCSDHSKEHNNKMRKLRVETA